MVHRNYNTEPLQLFPSYKQEVWSDIITMYHKCFLATLWR